MSLRGNYCKDRILRGLSLIIGDGLFINDGEPWQRRRRLMSPVFHRQRLDGVVTTRTEVITTQMDRWPPRIARGEPVDLFGEMVPININILLTAIFGISISDEESLLMRRASDVIFHHSEKLVFSFFVPIRIPRPGHRRFTAALRTIDKLVAKLLATRHRDAQDAGDLLSMLLLARDEETGEGLTDEQIRNEVMGPGGPGVKSPGATRQPWHPPSMVISTRAEQERLGGLRRFRR